MKKPLLALLAFSTVLLSGCRNLGKEVSRDEFEKFYSETFVMARPEYEKIETKGKIVYPETNDTKDLNTTLQYGVARTTDTDRFVYTFIQTQAPLIYVLQSINSFEKSEVKFFIDESKVEYSIKMNTTFDDTYIDTMGNVVKSNKANDITYTWNKYADLIYMVDHSKYKENGQIYQKNIEFSATYFYK